MQHRLTRLPALVKRATSRREFRQAGRFRLRSTRYPPWTTGRTLRPVGPLRPIVRIRLVRIRLIRIRLIRIRLVRIRLVRIRLVRIRDRRSDTWNIEVHQRHPCFERLAVFECVLLDMRGHRRIDHREMVEQRRMPELGGVGNRNRQADWRADDCDARPGLLELP